jgi:hypothetical protein
MGGLGAAPWRFRAPDYTAAADAAVRESLRGTPVPASWDPALTTAMQQRGLAIPEEAVASALFADLEG